MELNNTSILLAQDFKSKTHESELVMALKE